MDMTLSVENINADKISFKETMQKYFAEVAKALAMSTFIQNGGYGLLNFDKE